MIHWLVVNVWPTTLRTIVSAITGAFVAAMIVAPARGAFKVLRKRISSAIDSLDPDVPVGLTKQIDDLHGQLQQLNGHVAGTLNVRQTEPLRVEPHVALDHDRH